MNEKELTAKQRQYFRQYRPKNTDRDWDLLRMKLPDLEILSLPVSPLYLEVVGSPWPGKRRNDPIHSYFDCSYQELIDRGMKPKEIDLLMSLVAQVIRTEQGEKEMVRSDRITAQTNDFFLRTLEKFGVRSDLPIDFVSLNEESLVLCGGAGADDLEKILRQAILLSEKKVLNGELKDLINAVSTESQQLMAQFLPIIPGERGVKPWKAMQNVLSKIPRSMQTALLVFFRSGSEKIPESDRVAFEGHCKRLEMIGLEFRALFPVESRAVRDETEGAEEVFSSIQDSLTRQLAEAVIQLGRNSNRKGAQNESRKRVSFVRGLLGRVGAN
tara:strand:+ start:39816 stop:40799 length:984 start_codon:yes stop_codon:yes gene_type:complete